MFKPISPLAKHSQKSGGVASVGLIAIWLSACSAINIELAAATTAHPSSTPGSDLTAPVEQPTIEPATHPANPFFIQVPNNVTCHCPTSTNQEIMRSCIDTLATLAKTNSDNLISERHFCSQESQVLAGPTPVKFDAPSPTHFLMLVLEDSTEIENQTRPIPTSENETSLDDLDGESPNGGEADDGNDQDQGSSKKTSRAADKDPLVDNGGLLDAISRNLKSFGFVAFILFTAFTLSQLGREIASGQAPEFTSVFTRFGGDVSGWRINAAMLWLLATIAFATLSFISFQGLAA